MHPQDTLIQEAPKVNSSAQETAKLTVGGKALDLPVITGTEQERAIDVTRLRASTGHVTLDPGYANTGACTSAITFLDGEKGILRYRGIPIEELAASASYPETAYLLIYGELPSKSQLDHFNAALAKRAALPSDLSRLIEQIPPSAHPMATLSAAVQLLSANHADLTDPHPNKQQREEVLLTILAKFPALCAATNRRLNNQALVKPAQDLPYTANFLNLTFGKEPDPVTVEALTQMLILHADHEQNCSTSTVRLVGSSRASAFTSISAGIGALWGPLHGGANQAVIEMLEQVGRGGGDVNSALAKAKDKTSGFRLMGFGHRVYKNFDPRSRIIKVACDRVLSKLGVHDPLLDLAKRLEEAALKDDYFVSRKLYPNVDFYSGIILRAIGIPTKMFTVIFALGRIGGWLAHWKEMLEAPDFRICRPRQIYTGPTQRPYVPLNSRG